MDRDRLFNVMDQCHFKRGVTLVVNGGAKGADQLSMKWAMSRQLCFLTMPAQWDQYGKKAGMIRNESMLENPWDITVNLIVAFKGGIGTRGMITLGRQRQVEVVEVP